MATPLRGDFVPRWKRTGSAFSGMTVGSAGLLAAKLAQRDRRQRQIGKVGTRREDPKRLCSLASLTCPVTHPKMSATHAGTSVPDRPDNLPLSRHRKIGW